MANVHLAIKQNLKIIPVINKIDLPNADIERCKSQLEDMLAIPGEEAILASAKEGIGIEDILEAIVARIPPPQQCDRRLQLRGAGVRFDLRHLPRRGHLCARLLRRDEGRRRRSS